MLTSLLRSSTIRQSLTVTLGTVIFTAVGAAFFIVTARILGPGQFGILSFLTTLLVLCTDVFDFGTNGGIIRFVSESLASHDSYRAHQALKLSLKIKLLSGVLIVFLGLPLAPWIASTFLGDWSLWPLVFLAFLAVLPSLLYDFASFTLQAYQRYQEYVILALTSNTFKLLLLPISIAMTSPLIGSLAALIMGMIIALVYGFWRIKLDFVHVKVANTLWPKLYRFNRFLALTFIAVAISAKLDIFFLARYSTLVELGIYGLASKLTFIFPQIVGGLATVLGPKFGRFTSVKDAHGFLWKSFLMTSGLAASVILLAILSPIIVSPLFGNGFSKSVPVFQVLLLGTVFLLVQVGPTLYITYFLARPSYSAIFAFGQLILVTILNLWFIPKYGALGASLTYLLSQAFIFLVSLTTIVVVHKRRSQEFSQLRA